MPSESPEHEGMDDYYYIKDSQAEGAKEGIRVSRPPTPQTPDLVRAPSAIMPGSWLQAPSEYAELSLPSPVIDKSTTATVVPATQLEFPTPLELPEPAFVTSPQSPELAARELPRHQEIKQTLTQPAAAVERGPAPAPVPAPPASPLGPVLTFFHFIASIRLPPPRPDGMDTLERFFWTVYTFFLLRGLRWAMNNLDTDSMPVVSYCMYTIMFSIAVCSTLCALGVAYPILAFSDIIERQLERVEVWYEAFWEWCQNEREREIVVMLTLRLWFVKLIVQVLMGAVAGTVLLLCGLGLWFMFKTLGASCWNA